MTTLIHIRWLRTILFIVSLVIVFVGLQFLQTATVEAQLSEPTMEYNLMKKFSGPYPVGYSADQFTFDIAGASASGTVISLTNIALAAYTIDTATAVVNLPMGTYTISENGPVGFVSEDWTVQWSDPKGCVQQTNQTTSIVIDDNNFGLGNVGCRADNQWFPAPAPILGCTDPNANNYDPAATDDDGACEYDYPNSGNNGTLIVEKIVVGGTATTTDFSFSVNGGISTPFEVDGSNEMAVASGTYSVIETSTSTGYTVSYNNCTNVVVVSSSTATCIITNTYSTNGGGDGDDDGEPTYLVFGYVWHDKNANTQWETDEPNPEDDEVDLDAWTVQITNGSTTLSTTTDETGYYYFNVEAGTWTIIEVLQDGWIKTFPEVNGHEVVVIDESITETKKTNFFASVIQFLVPVAYAQTTTTYGPFDFGNVFYGTGGGNGNDDDDDGNGGSSGSSSGGSSTKPKPTVLGDATDIIPLGAPDTGAGGTSPLSFGFQITAVALPSRKIY